MSRENRARLIAFYLPQFHPIPENDRWWGAGFTEWRNVAQGRPRFRGHYQPHLPADLGFYDLRLGETRIAQAKLAEEYGVEGFCYWHYWFGGKRLLERPFNEVLASGQPDFPFCLAWANETWSRLWDGHEHHVLQAQTYPGPEDDLAHIRSLIPALTDHRAIKIEGKPVFLVYRPTNLPDAPHTLRLWRQEAQAAGLPGLHLLAIETAYTYRQSWRDDVARSLGLRREEAYASTLDWRGLGFDGVVLFQPNVHMMRPHWLKRGVKRVLSIPTERLERIRGLKGYVSLQYEEAWRATQARKPTGEDWFPCVTPGWDNTSRRRNGRPTIFKGSSPQSYEKWLRQEVAAVEGRAPDHRLVFVNAWNEWAEGCHLEPDLRYGRAYLEATRRAVEIKRVEHGRQ